MARKVVDYHVVEHWVHHDFREKLLKWLGQGWELHGGLVLTFNDGGSIKTYAQAVVKYEEKNS